MKDKEIENIMTGISLLDKDLKIHETDFKVLKKEKGKEMAHLLLSIAENGDEVNKANHKITAMEEDIRKLKAEIIERNKKMQKLEIKRKRLEEFIKNKRTKEKESGSKVTESQNK